MTRPDEARRIVAARLGDRDSLVPLALRPRPVDGDRRGEAIHTKGDWLSSSLGAFFSHAMDMPRVDGVASILIGLLLAGAAVLLIRESRGLLEDVLFIFRCVLSGCHGLVSCAGSGRIVPEKC